MGKHSGEWWVISQYLHLSNTNSRNFSSSPKAHGRLCCAGCMHGATNLLGHTIPVSRSSGWVRHRVPVEAKPTAVWVGSLANISSKLWRGGGRACVSLLYATISLTIFKYNACSRALCTSLGLCSSVRSYQISFCTCTCVSAFILRARACIRMCTRHASKRCQTAWSVGACHSVKAFSVCSSVWCREQFTLFHLTLAFEVAITTWPIWILNRNSKWL